MCAETNRDRFIEICHTYIHREGIKELLEYLDSTDFFIAPASTKYHGSWEGGLVEHTLNVYYELDCFLRYLYQDTDYHEYWTDESIAIVSLFHDLCKIGRYKTDVKNVKDSVTGVWESKTVYTFNNDYECMGHGSKSLSIVQSYIKLTDEEKYAIFGHMGMYDTSNYYNCTDVSNGFKRNTLAFALHMADMISTHTTENELFKS